MAETFLYSFTESTILVFGAIFCCVIGSFFNTVAISAIMKKQSVRQKRFSPLFFYQSLTNLLMCLIYLPTMAFRFYKREQMIDYINPQYFCQFYVLSSYSLTPMVVYLLTIIGLHRALHLKYPNNEFFTWTKTSIYLSVLFVVTMGCLLVPATETWGIFAFVKSKGSCEIKYVICMYL